MREARAVVATIACGMMVAGIAWGVLATQEGCQLQSVCTPKTGWWPGPAPTSGFDTPQYAINLPNPGAVDDTTWQTGGLNDAWLEFKGGQSYAIFPFMTADAGGLDRFYGPYTDITAWVSADEHPNTPGTNFALASGNLAEFFLVSDPTSDQYDGRDASSTPPVFNVTNATCADYYLRVVIHRRASLDAGAALDSSPSGPIDASSDAGAD